MTALKIALFTLLGMWVAVLCGLGVLMALAAVSDWLRLRRSIRDYEYLRWLEEQFRTSTTVDHPEDLWG